MSKFTPAPWEFNGSEQIFGDTGNQALDGDSPLLCTMFGNGAAQKANAALIAAAPDMYEALEEYTKAAQRAYDSLKSGWNVHGVAATLERANIKAHKALDKARGES